MIAHDTHPARSHGGGTRRVLAWVLLSLLAAMVGWLGFRGYLNPELLFHFANSLYC